MIKQYQLKNGLKVLLVESHKSPVVSLQAWVRTGSADETAAEAGISHFIEHLLFKGTRRFKVGEVAQVIEGSGGELNAYTSFDQTVFYMTMSKHFIQTGLTALSEMMGFPQFDPAEIDAEREVVVEEMRRGQDSLGRRASQLLFKTAYGKHPYGRPVIGLEKIIRKVSPKVIRSYFEGRYNPKNMFLLVSGDFETTQTKKWIQETFGEIAGHPLRKVKRPQGDKITRPRVKYEKSDFEQTVLYLAWPIPKIDHKDIPALDLLAFVLGIGETSRLVQRLRMKEPLVQSVGANTFTPNDQGLFLISTGFNSGNPKQILKAIEEEMARLMTDGISKEEIQRAVTNMQSEELYSLETVDGLARKYGHLEFHFRDIKMLPKYMKAVRGLTASDLQKAMVKYLLPQSLVMTCLEGKSTTGTHQAMKEFAQSYRKLQGTFKKVPPRTPRVSHAPAPRFHSVSKAPEAQVHILKNGDRVLYRPSFDTPVVSVRVAGLGGMRAETSGQSGICELVSRSWLGGTTRSSEEEISRRIEGLAASLGPVGGKHSLALSADLLSPSIKPMVALWQEVLTSPTFPVDVIDRERQLQLHQIQAKKDNPSQICMNLFSQGLFGDHAYSRDQLGTSATLSSLRQVELVDWWQKTFLQQKKVYAISGATELAPWLDAIAGAGMDQEHASLLIDSPAITYPLSPLVYFEKVEKEQTHLICGYPGLTLTDPDRYALQILQSVLAGQGGRLFLELRDKNSLAYSVSPLRMEGLDGGYFGAYIGCAPAKTETALRMMREQFSRLCNESVGADELDRAKRYIIGRHDIDLQRASAISASMLYNDLYGIDYLEAFNCDEKYWAVSADEIQKLAQRIFSKPPVVAVAGPQPLDPGAIEA